MKKIFLLIFLSLTFSLSANADYFLKNKNKCVSDFWYDQNTGYVYYIYSDKPDTEYKSFSKSYVFIPGYEYNSSVKTCSLPVIVKQLSLTSSDYNFLMALLGLLIGFSFLLSIILIFKRGK